MAESYGARLSSIDQVNQPASQSRSPLRMVVEALKGLLAGIVGALLALFSGLVVLLGILVSVLPLLLVIGAVAGGIYLIVH
jgi:uncharacterized membrane protein